MDTQIKLPKTFAELLSILCGKNIGLSCTKGRMVYFGTLKDIAKKCITIEEKGILKTIPFSYISSLNLTEKDNFPPDSNFVKMDSKLFEQYHEFIGQKVTIRRKDKTPWDETGILKHIAKDYIVVLDTYDNVFHYLYATVEWDMIPR